MIARLNVGGPALHCTVLSERLISRGYDTVLVTGSPEEGEADYETLNGVQARGYRVVRFPTMRRSVNVFRDLILFFRTWKVIRQEKPTIVHTHTAKAGVLGRAAAILAGVPIVVHTFHGHVLEGYFSPWLSRAVARLERVLAWKTDAIVTLSPQLKRDLAHRFRVAPESKIQIIPLGRDLKPFQDSDRWKGALRRELGLMDPQIRILGTVGRLVSIKNQELLLRAFAQVRVPGVEPHLVLVGEGPMLGWLRSVAESLKISERVHFIGWRSQLERVLPDFDVFALTSDNEGTPLSVIEAWAAGCPVVSTSVGGVPDMFSHPEPSSEGWTACTEGLLVPKGDSAALVLAFEEMLKNPDRRKAASMAAREAASQYSDDRLAERMDCLYSQLIQDRKGMA